MRIAICGAGIAGPTAAYWLLRSGHVPTLIERAPTLRTGGYVIDFWGIGFRVAQLMNLEYAVLDAGYRVRTLRGVRSDGRSFTNIDVGAFADAVDGRYTTIARSDLAAVIYSSIAHDVETVFDDTVTAIDNRPDGVTVSFERSPAREFDLVLGADGLHSAVRDIAFGAADAEHYLGCAVAAFTVAGYRPRDELTYVLYNVAGAQVGRFALRDDRTLFLFVFRCPDPRSVRNAGDVRALLRARFETAGWECRPILEQLESASDVYFDAVSQIRSDHWSRGRVVLLGDAAAAVSLLAGEGTGLAMLEGYVLAGELARASGDHRIAFDAYERRLRTFVADKQRSAYTFLPFFTATTRLGLGLRNLGMRTMSIRALAKLLASRSFRDDIELPDYST